MQSFMLPPDEAEQIARQKTQSRLKFLAGFLMITVVARIFIHNPAPPKTPNHSGKPFRALPGVYKNLSEAERRKLTPQQVAALKEADNPQKQTAVAQYIPEAKPIQHIVKEAAKFEYMSKRFRRPAPVENAPEVDTSKDTLVLFAQGGFLKVKEAETVNGWVHIDIDKTIQAAVPKIMVRKIAGDATNWTEPIPVGQVQLKPAKGITVVVRSSIANRITVPRDEDDDI